MVLVGMLGSSTPEWMEIRHNRKKQGNTTQTDMDTRQKWQNGYSNYGYTDGDGVILEPLRVAD